jgi:transposase
MTNLEKKTIRYSFSFKQLVVKEIEEGFSISATAKKYGINGGETIKKWIKKFGKNHLLNKIVRIEMIGEADRVKQLENELKEAKVALADSLLAQRCYELLINEINREYHTDVKKNFGLNVSSKKP